MVTGVFHAYVQPIYQLPNYKIVGWSNLKAFADNKIFVTEKLIFFSAKGRKYCNVQ